MTVYDFLVEKTVRLLAPRLGCKRDDPTYDRLWYGAYVFYLNAVKCLLLLALALLLGITRYVLAFALAYGALRTFSFGVHLNRPVHCTLLGLAYYLGSTYLSLHVPFSLGARIIIAVLCSIVFLACAPAETEKRPIPKSRRGIYKLKSCLLLSALSLLGIWLHGHYPVYGSLISMALICQSINLLPVTFHIIRRIEENEKNSESHVQSIR